MPAEKLGLVSMDISYNCRQATYLIEKAALVPLTPQEVQGLAFHLENCPLCEIYQRQSIMINRAVQDLFLDAATIEEKLSDTSKSKIQRSIEDYLSGS